jgi:hypothetical protein
MAIREAYDRYRTDGLRPLDAKHAMFGRIGSVRSCEYIHSTT